MTDDNINTRPTDPAAATVVPSVKMRTVKLDPTFCPAGSGAMVAGKVYTVEVGSVLSVPDSLSDEAVRAELGAMLLPGEAK